MPFYPIQIEPFGRNVDARGVWLKGMLWEREKRAPVTVQMFVSYGELRAVLREVEQAREEEAQERMF